MQWFKVILTACHQKLSFVIIVIITIIYMSHTGTVSSLSATNPSSLNARHRPSFIIPTTPGSTLLITLQLHNLLGGTHVAQRPLLDHQSHDLIQRILECIPSAKAPNQHVQNRQVKSKEIETHSSSHSGEFGVCVVSGCYLDDVGGDEVDAFEAANDGAEFACGPAAGFGGAGCGCDCGSCTLAVPSICNSTLSRISNVQAGSSVSISILRYTGFSKPTLSLIFLIMPSVPILSTSRASTISKPQ